MKKCKKTAVQAILNLQDLLAIRTWEFTERYSESPLRKNKIRIWRPEVKVDRTALTRFSANVTFEPKLYERIGSRQLAKIKDRIHRELLQNGMAPGQGYDNVTLAVENSTLETYVDVTGKQDFTTIVLERKKNTFSTERQDTFIHRLVTEAKHIADLCDQYSRNIVTGLVPAEQADNFGEVFLRKDHLKDPAGGLKLYETIVQWMAPQIHRLEGYPDLSISLTAFGKPKLFRSLKLDALIGYPGAQIRLNQKLFESYPAYINRVITEAIAFAEGAASDKLTVKRKRTDKNRIVHQASKPDSTERKPMNNVGLSRFKVLLAATPVGLTGWELLKSLQKVNLSTINIFFPFRLKIPTLQQLAERLNIKDTGLLLEAVKALAKDRWLMLFDDQSIVLPEPTRQLLQHEDLLQSRTLTQENLIEILEMQIEELKTLQKEKDDHVLQVMQEIQEAKAALENYPTADAKSEASSGLKTLDSEFPTLQRVQREESLQMKETGLKLLVEAQQQALENTVRTIARFHNTQNQLRDIGLNSKTYEMLRQSREDNQVAHGLYRQFDNLVREIHREHHAAAALVEVSAQDARSESGPAKDSLQRRLDQVEAGQAYSRAV